jgi:signal transduction histidine kinase
MFVPELTFAADHGGDKADSSPVARTANIGETAPELHTCATERSRYLEMVVHDLRHPLTSMRLLVHLIRSESCPVRRGEYYDVLDDRLKALAALVDELADHERVAPDDARLRLDCTNICALVSDCTETFGPAQGEGECTIVCTVDPGLTEVLTDASKIRHILMNLISNALKFTNAGTIAIRCAGEDSYWSLQVEDTGRGFRTAGSQGSGDELAHPEPQSATRRSSLGLSIVKRLCDALQAEMHIQSKAGTGTIVRIVFPLLRSS